jgi:hypothetical protein
VKSHHSANDWRPGTKRRLIAEYAEKNMPKRDCFRELRVLVDNQVKPMIFTRNPITAMGEKHRVPMPIAEQLIALKNEIGRVYAILGKAASADFESEEIDDSDTAVETEEIQPETEPEIEDSEDDEIPADGMPHPPRAKGKQTVKDELNYFLRRMREIESFCRMREEQSEAVDDLGNRPYTAASRLIPAGIPADALLAAMVLQWPQDTRNDAGIADYDFERLSSQIMEERELEFITRSNGKVERLHKMFGYVLTLAEERIPVYLYGPQGTGKSHLAAQLADYLEIPYGETAMSAGATRGDLLGRLTASSERPFILSKFCEIYSGGGVFNFEEIDAALPEVLITLNNALAGSKFFNSSNGEDYFLHADTIPVATANTLGTGATRMYVARERLDSATLDRWRMGRTKIEVDPKIQESILFSKV